MMGTNQESQKKFLVVDDHPAIQEATVAILLRQYPGADIKTAQSSTGAKKTLLEIKPDAVIVDLSIPKLPGEKSKLENGILLLQGFLEAYPEYNFVVQSAHISALIRVKPLVDQHMGGFTVVDKEEPLASMIQGIDMALAGRFLTPRGMRGNVLEVKPEWLQVLRLAFEESMEDKKIAKEMMVSLRTVRNYWSKLYDVLEVFPEEGKNLRLQTEKKAREKGLID